MQALRLKLFGTPALLQPWGTELLVSERLTQLAVVLAASREWLTREQLIGLLWPELDDASARRNLRKLLFRARRQPWFAGLEAREDALRWQVESDVHDFELACAEQDWARAVAGYGNALGFGFEHKAPEPFVEWLRFERDRLASAYRAAAAQHLAQLGDDPSGRESLARQWLLFDPLDEDALAAMVGALNAQGRAGEAQRAVDEFTRRLRNDLGVEPSVRVGLLATGAAPATSMVTDHSGFIGRHTELAEVGTLLLRDQCRLLTVTGPGGVGKSRLVKHALPRLAPAFDGGVYWIALDDLDDTAPAVARLAAELDVYAERDLLRAIARHLEPRRVLVVFDNCEHLPGLARTIDVLLAEAPAVKICATSRVRLGTRGEWLMPLGGLSVPAPHADTAVTVASDAAQLFIAAARTVKPDFDPLREAGGIGDVARAVGGMPLALMLAANWVRFMRATDIASELIASLDVLEAAEDGEERAEHRSVRATFERSWVLLAARERRALKALSVFVGSFSLEAARAVADASLPLLAALADKSMLQMKGPRCTLHPLLRQFAGEMLDAEARATTVARHARHYHRRLAQLTTAAQAANRSALDEIGIDLENCRQAWRWAIAQRDAAAIAGSAVALKEYFNVRGRVAEGLELLGEARSVADESEPACAAILMAAIAQTHYRLSQLDDAAASARHGLRLARLAGHRGALVRCASVLGTCCWQWGRHVEARRLLQQAARLAHAGGDKRGAALATHNLSLVEKALGNHARAAELMRAWISTQREQGEWLRVAMGLSNLAYVYQAQGEWSLALASLEEGLALCDSHDLAMPRPALLANLAHSHAMSGRLDDAERVCVQLLEEAGRKALADVEATALNQMVRLAILRGDLALARSRLAVAANRATTLGIEYVALDCVLSYAKILCGEGRVADAAPLLRQLLARPDLEPVDRADAQAHLSGLPEAMAQEEPLPHSAIEPMLLSVTAGLVTTAAGGHSSRG
jgi:predicted ATPase/DNA-binding SARP family transcriptional activator